MVRIAWEAVLLLGALVVLALGVADGHFFGGGGPWPQLAIFGLLAAGLALSLRTGTPNLAVTGVAQFAGLLYVQLRAPSGGSGDGLPDLPAILAVLVACLAVGVVLALITGLTGAPAWAVSLGGLALVLTVSFAAWGSAPTRLLVPHGGPQDNPNGLLTAFAVVFAVGSVAAGLLWLLPGVRAVTVAGDARLGRRLLASLVGLGGSSLLAGLAGVLQAKELNGAGLVEGDQLLLLVFGAAVLGGASLSGRGGGIAGTVLATFILVGAGRLAVLHGAAAWTSTFLPAAVAIVVGVLASQLFDWLGTRTAAAMPVDQPGPLTEVS